MKLKDFMSSTVDNRGRNPEKYYEIEQYPVIDNYLIKNSIYPDMSAVNRYIDQNTFDHFLRGYVHRNMPIMTLVGNGIGNVTLAPSDDVAIIQNTIGFECNDKVDEVFLYYYLLYRQEFIRKFDRGSGQPSIRKTDLLDMEVNVPNISKQKRIREVLFSIDEKIENNNVINNNLEQQMQALYKAWFVDFKPFGGVRPSNWNDTNIYAIANIIYGAPFASKLFNTDGLGKPIIRIRDLKEQAFVTFTTEEHPKGHLIQPGDIVVGMDGEFRPYIWGNEPAWLNQRVCIFESNRPQGKAFVLYTIKPLLNKIEQTQVATTVIHIGKKDFDAFEIILPDESTLDSFDSITAPMIEQIVNNRLQNKRLAVLRDTLLPKLMSGELDVSNIEI